MFKPLHDRVLILPDKKVERVTFGIVIPEGEEKPATGIVIATNKSKVVKKGDHVYFSKFGFDPVKIDDKEYYVVSELNLLGIYG